MGAPMTNSTAAPPPWVAARVLRASCFEAPGDVSYYAQHFAHPKMPYPENYNIPPNNGEPTTLTTVLDDLTGLMGTLLGADTPSFLDIPVPTGLNPSTPRKL